MFPNWKPVISHQLSFLVILETRHIYRIGWLGSKLYVYKTTFFFLFSFVFGHVRLCGTTPRLCLIILWYNKSRFEKNTEAFKKLNYTIWNHFVRIQPLIQKKLRKQKIVHLLVFAMLELHYCSNIYWHSKPACAPYYKRKKKNPRDKTIHTKLLLLFFWKKKIKKINKERKKKPQKQSLHLKWNLI